MLLEDLGEQLMQPLLNDETVDKLYGQAELMLLSIQNSAPDTQIFPIYEKASLAQEFDLFAAWFVKNY